MTTTDTKTTDPRVAQLAKLLQGVGGAPALADLLKVIAPTELQVEAPATAPSAPVITDDERKAITDLPAVFGKVVTTEPRLLAVNEAEALMRERLALDSIASLVEKRKKALRTIVFNHLDVAHQGGADRDEKGHKLVPGELSAPAIGKKFIREIAEGARMLGVEGLEDLVTLGRLDRDDFLAMTRQVRVVDDAKVALLLRRKPELGVTIASAVKVGARVAKFCVRAIKKP